MRSAVSFQNYDDFGFWQLSLGRGRGEKNSIPAPQTGVVLRECISLKPSALVLVNLGELWT
ncbi:MAG: hypothetical protein ACREDG_06410, partial [Methylocella sp.]